MAFSINFLLAILPALAHITLATPRSDLRIQDGNGIFHSSMLSTSVPITEGTDDLALNKLYSLAYQITDQTRLIDSQSWWRLEMFGSGPYAVINTIFEMANGNATAVVKKIPGLTPPDEDEAYEIGESVDSFVQRSGKNFDRFIKELDRISLDVQRARFAAIVVPVYVKHREVINEYGAAVAKYCDEDEDFGTVLNYIKQFNTKIDELITATNTSRGDKDVGPPRRGDNVRISIEFVA